MVQASCASDASNVRHVAHSRMYLSEIPSCPKKQNVNVNAYRTQNSVTYSPSTDGYYNKIYILCIARLA